MDESENNSKPAVNQPGNNYPLKAFDLKRCFEIFFAVVSAEETMEEDESMEMEIDETVPDTPIIENKRNSDDFIALMQGLNQKSGSATQPEGSVTELAQPTSAITEVPSSSNDIESFPNPVNATEPSPAEPPITVANTETPSKPTTVAVDDDDIEIIDVSTPSSVPLKTYKPKRIIADDDVVCIDDDDDVQQTKNRSASRRPVPEIKEYEVIDLVDNKKGSVNSKCINYSCKSGVDFMIAPAFCLTFYRVKSSENKKQEVCRACCDIALQHFDNLAKSLQQGDLLVKLDIPIRNDLVEIDDSDSENEMDEDDLEGLDEFNLLFLKESLEKCLEETMEKYNLKEHAYDSMVYLKEKGNDIKSNEKLYILIILFNNIFWSGKYTEVDTMLHDVRKKLDTIHHAVS